MSKRTYSIPTIAAVGLSMATGCSEPIVGTWSITEVTFDGETYQIPYVYNYTYEGSTYSYTTDFTMTVNDELTGEWVTDYSYSGPDGSESGSETYELEITKTSKATYDIKIEGIEFDGSCTVTSTVLSCDGVDSTDENYSIEFEAELDG